MKFAPNKLVGWAATGRDPTRGSNEGSGHFSCLPRKCGAVEDWCRRRQTFRMALQRTICLGHEDRWPWFDCGGHTRAGQMAESAVAGVLVEAAQLFQHEPARPPFSGHTCWEKRGPTLAVSASQGSAAATDPQESQGSVGEAVEFRECGSAGREKSARLPAAMPGGISAAAADSPWLQESSAAESVSASAWIADMGLEAK